MQTLQNDFKNCAVTIWPTSQKEYKKEPIFKVRIKNDVNVSVGDFIEVQGQNAMKGVAGVYYKIEKILEQTPSKSYPDMTVYKCEFSRHAHKELA